LPLGHRAGMVRAVKDDQAEPGAAAEHVVDLAAMGTVERHCIEFRRFTSRTWQRVAPMQTGPHSSV
jgi:hypothetical protein